MVSKRLKLLAHLSLRLKYTYQTGLCLRRSIQNSSTQTQTSLIGISKLSIQNSLMAFTIYCSKFYGVQKVKVSSSPDLKAHKVSL